MPIVTTSARRRPRGRSSRFALRASLAIATVVLVAIAVYLGARAARPRQAPPTVSDTTESHAPARPPRDRSPRPQEEASAGEPPAPPEGEASVPAEETNRPTVQPSNSQTNSPLDEAELERRKWEAERRLKHGTEQLLAMIISTDTTGVPPLPVSEEDEESLRRDLLVAITNDISIFEDEDERTQEVKERVAEAKRQLADILQKGGSVVEAIKEYEAYVNEGAKVRTEVLEKIAPEVEAITNDADAVEYVESVNEALKKEDIPPIKLEEVGFEVEETPK